MRVSDYTENEKEALLEIYESNFNESKFEIGFWSWLAAYDRRFLLNSATY